MEKGNNLRVIMVNPSKEAMATTVDDFKQETIVLMTNNGDSIAKAFHSVLETDAAEFNLLLHGDFGVYSRENIERSLSILQDGIYKYGIYGMYDANGYWTPQVSINKRTHEKFFLNCPVIIRKEILGSIDFDGIKNREVYHSILRQIHGFVGVDFCFPGIKVCQK